ncbi:Hypothetical protein HEAR1246 [Herminiimonas arsenicoxydans]|uniref:Uncharacterized protein n=1 Tax=Herminiimonas arsenicoxydans TaxID=204773 RepID=A4G4I4_HERAR|nr:Hypothetical protein HEAR1246 [Herminiimonas arsenicoxydans]
MNIYNLNLCKLLLPTRRVSDVQGTMFLLIQHHEEYFSFDIVILTLRLQTSLDNANCHSVNTHPHELDR